MKIFLLFLFAFFIQQQHCMFQKRQSFFQKYWPFKSTHQRFIDRQVYLNNRENSFIHKIQAYFQNLLTKKVSQIKLIKKQINHSILEDSGLQTFSF